jgi:hypothetical protein
MVMTSPGSHDNVVDRATGVDQRKNQSATGSVSTTGHRRAERSGAERSEHQLSAQMRVTASLAKPADAQWSGAMGLTYGVD